MNLFLYNLHFHTVSFHIISIHSIRNRKHKLFFFRPKICLILSVFFMKSKLVGKSHICLRNKDFTKTDSVKNIHSQHSHSQHSLREGMCKSHYGNQDFSPLVNVVYFILIIIKIPLRNGNCPIGHCGPHYRNGSRTCLCLSTFTNLQFSPVLRSASLYSRRSSIGQPRVCSRHPRLVGSG